MGEKVKYLHQNDHSAQAPESEGTTEPINIERAQKVLPILAKLIGVNNHVS
jgi:hypothetical protein